MKLKFQLLKTLSILTLIALTSIQGYLVYNTYQLKKKSLLLDARSSIAKIYTTKKVDSLMWLYRNDFLQQLESYKTKEIDKRQVINNLKRKAKQINTHFYKVYEAELKNLNQPYNIKFKKEVAFISLKDPNNNVDIFINNSNLPIFLIGENFSDEEEILINNSSWTKNHDLFFKGELKPHFLRFNTRIYMSIINIKHIILKQMTGLMLLSCLLFLFVIGLLYYSIVNLMKQKRLTKIKTDFINNITHELKTPLTTIFIATKTLNSKFINNDKEIAKDAIHVINRQNIRLQKLIDQVVQNSLGYHDIYLKKDLFNGSVFIKNIVDDFTLSLNKNIEIITEINLMKDNIIADKFHLTTVIINILNNAIKYKGSKIKVSYKTDKKSHIIKIKDNGIGIPKSKQKYIYDKFYRVNEKDIHNFKGLGLGLYYCDQIIKAHNGTIALKSKESIGSTFIIKIPLS